MGTPYHDQASRRGVGCDRLGLVRGVWREVVGDEPLAGAFARLGRGGQPRDNGRGGLGDHAVGDTPRLEPGMLLLFCMRRGAIAKHCGTTAGTDTFIHAYERLGVIEEALMEA